MTCSTRPTLARILLLLHVAILHLVLHALPAAHASSEGCNLKDNLVMVGGMDTNSSVAVLRMNPCTGVLQRVTASTAGGISPAFIAWHQGLSEDATGYVFVSNHGGSAPGTGLTVARWVQDPSTQQPNITSMGPAGFTSAVPNPDFVTVHMTGKWVFTTAYDNDSLTATAISGRHPGTRPPVTPAPPGGQQRAKDVKLGRSVTFPISQIGLAPHMAKFDPTGRYLYVPCLGSDWVRMFKFNRWTGQLTPNRDAQGNNTFMTPAGSGPRHIIFHPTLPSAYIITELASTLIHAHWDRDGSRRLRALSRPDLPSVFSTLPPGTPRGCPIRSPDPTCPTQAAAEVALSADGRFLYASNRGQRGGISNVAIFSIHPATGNLTALAWETGGGDVDFPRHISLSPDPANSFLLVANQNSNTVTSFARNATSGMLSKVMTLDLGDVVSQASFVSVVPPPW